MNILVTGGAGFIGSHLTDRLIEMGHDVCIIDNLSTGKRENINNHATFYEMDIADEAIARIFKKHAPHMVFHLAAQIDVRKSVKEPLDDARSNILGTINLLSQCIRSGVNKFVFASSGGVIYGETPKPAKEEDPPRPISPYGVAKLAGEGYITCFGEWHDLDFTILRYANVFGPRQDPKGEAGVVSILIGQIEAGERSVLFGDGKLERDYVYIDDVVQANISCMENGSREIFNIGTGIATSVESLHTQIAEVMGKGNEKTYMPKRAGELDRNVLSCEKASRELSWNPGTGLKEGLERTYAWFRGRA